MLVIYIITSALTTDLKEQAQILAKQEKELMEAQKEKMRANLLRAVSHDLRTPLTGIIGNSDSYIDMEDKLSTEEKRHIIDNFQIHNFKKNQVFTIIEFVNGNLPCFVTISINAFLSNS